MLQRDTKTAKEAVLRFRVISVRQHYISVRVNKEKRADMKSMLCLVALVAVCSVNAAPQQQYTSPIPIIRLNNDVNPDGTYQFSFETGNGIQAQEQGALKNPGTPDEAMSAQGSFSYTGPDGVQYSLQYTADDNGFLAQGAHLPTPPPIPEALQKAIEFAERNSDPNDDGLYKPQSGR